MRVDRSQLYKKLAGIIVLATLCVVGISLAVVLDHKGDSDGQGSNSPEPAQSFDPATFAGYQPLVVISLDAFKPEYLRRNYPPALAALGRM